MFGSVKKEIIEYNENKSNEELYKRIIKKKILSKVFGIILMILGFGGAFACFILVATSGKIFLEDGFTSRIIVPLILIVPCGIIGGAGSMLLTISAYINSNLNIYQKALAASLASSCVNCGHIIKKDEVYCPKCGKPMNKTCQKCGEECNQGDTYCKKCGSKF